MGTLDGVIQHPVVRELIRVRWWVLSAWMGVQFLLGWLVNDRFGDWGYFHEAAGRMFGQEGTPAQHGIHVYATTEHLQFGLPPILLAELARLTGPHSREVFDIAILVLGMAALVVLERLVLRLRPESATRLRAQTLLLGLFAVPVWAQLYQAEHIDDALVLTAAVAIFFSITWRRPWLAAVLAGTAAAGKPWAVILLPLLLALPPRQRVRAVLLACAVLLIWWAPVLLDPHTLPALVNMPLRVADNAPLHLLTPGAVFKPWWVRPAQFVLGPILVGVLVLRGQWPAALFAGIACRMVLDPDVYTYYWSGLFFAALIWVSVRPGRRSIIALVLTWGISRQILGEIRLPNAYVTLAFFVLVLVLTLSTVCTRGPDDLLGIAKPDGQRPRELLPAPG